MYLAQPERKRSFAEQNFAEMEDLLRQSWLLQSHRGLASHSSQGCNGASCLGSPLLPSVGLHEGMFSSIRFKYQAVVSQEIPILLEYINLKGGEIFSRSSFHLKCSRAEAVACQRMPCLFLLSVTLLLRSVPQPVLLSQFGVLVSSCIPASSELHEVLLLHWSWRFLNIWECSPGRKPVVPELQSVLPVQLFASRPMPTPWDCFSWYLKVIAYCNWRLHLFINTDLLTAAFCFFNTFWNCSWKLTYLTKVGAFGWLDLEWPDGLSHSCP